MSKNIYSLNATILRQRAYNQGRDAAKNNKSILSCPYDIISNRVSRDVWLQGFDNYEYERNISVEDYNSFA